MESGIQVPLTKNPESGTWNPEFIAWNPESQAVLDSIPINCTEAHVLTPWYGQNLESGNPGCLGFLYMLQYLSFCLTLHYDSTISLVNKPDYVLNDKNRFSKRIKTPVFFFSFIGMM